MLIRKNTKAFKTIKEIIVACSERADRRLLVRLYITRAGNTIAERVSVESIQGEEGLFYDMTYDTVRTNLDSSDRQLNQSDEHAGIYFFHSPSNKLWDETPFEFDIAIKDAFSTLSDLPAVRKKEKATKFILPVAKTHHSPKESKEHAQGKKQVKTIVRGPRQPNYHLKHVIEFTELEKIIFKEPRVSKKEVLDYYYNVSEHLLPHLKNRPLCITVLSHGRTKDYTNLDLLAEDVELPDWMQRTNPSKGKELGRAILCESKEQLLWYVEIGGVQFITSLSRIKSPSLPDFILLDLSSAEDDSATLIHSALNSNMILSGLQLNSFVKTDGKCGLQVYIALDSKSTYKTSKAVAEFVCKLMRLKSPELVAIESTGDNAKGKVALSYLCNGQQEYVIAPYSLVDGHQATPALPLHWEELKEEFSFSDLGYRTAASRLKQTGDPFETLSKKKVNAEDLLKHLESNYSFLI